MPDRSPLEPLTALGGRDPHQERIGAVTITERPDLALASLAARRGAALDAGLDGLALPGPGGHASGPDGTGALWIGPDAWLVEAPLDAPGALVARLKARHGDSASVTDQTDAWVCFDIAADDLAAVMERLAGLDLRAMPAGRGTRTIIDHLGCLVILREAGRRASILGPRSSADSLLHALTAAARAVEALKGIAA